MIFRAKLQTWLNRRFQYRAGRTLKQKDVLVFIDQQGLLYVVLILITFVAGINYANNLVLGFCFLISAILCISFYLTFKQLHALSVEITLPETGRVGEALTLRLFFKQQTSTPRYLFLKCGDQLQQLMVQGLSQTTEIHLLADQRGVYPMPRILLYSTYPLGLVRAWTYFYLSDEIWIAPRAQDFQWEDHAFANRGLPDMNEFHDLRLFQAGDSFQAVSWKQLARGQGLYVRQFEDQQDKQRLSIDYAHMPARLHEHSQEQPHNQSHEQKLSLMMGLVDSCEQRQIQYQLILPRAELAYGQGASQYLQARKLLAQA